MIDIRKMERPHRSGVLAIAVWELAGVKYLHAALLVVGIWLAGELALTVHRVRPHLEVTLTNLDRTIIVAGVAATHLEKASGTWEQSSKTQAEQIMLTTKSILRTTTAFGDLVARTDQSLNTQLLPNLNLAVVQENNSLLASQASLRQNLEEMGKATIQAQKVLVDADAQINSTDVKIALDNVATSSANLAAATSEAAASMKTIRTGLDYELKQLMAPVTKAKAALNISLLVIRRLFF